MAAMVRPSWSRALLACSLSWLASGCDGDVPSRNTLSGWPPGEPAVAGACSFVLTRANLYHSTEWHLDVEIAGQNTGPEEVKCGFSARAVTSSNTPLTDAAKGSNTLPPGESFTKEAASREADVTGLSSGAEEDAWVYVELSEGTWPMAKTTGVHVSPDRTRPPS